MTKFICPDPFACVVRVVSCPPRTPHPQPLPSIQSQYCMGCASITSRKHARKPGEWTGRRWIRCTDSGCMIHAYKTLDGGLTPPTDQFVRAHVLSTFKQSERGSFFIHDLITRCLLRRLVVVIVVIGGWGRCRGGNGRWRRCRGRDLRRSGGRASCLERCDFGILGR
jgi:hypothetical protein